MSTQAPDPHSPDSRSRDEAAIRQLVAEADAFQSDTERFAALLTEDVVIVNIAGIRITGRDEFRRIMALALESRLANVRTTSEVEDITFVRPDVALVSCIKQVFDENADATADVPSSGRLTFVVVSGKDGWRIALAQTTPVQA